MNNDRSININNIQNNGTYYHTTHMVSDIIRTDGYGLGTFSNFPDNKEENRKIGDDRDEINVNIFRYKFTEDFTKYLYAFAKIHQYDHRKDFKEAWQIWLDENEEIVGEEVRRLTNLCYDGDILDKMFKSARYYFRKKSTEKKIPSTRRVYRGVQKELLEAMDTHIKSSIKEEDYKPSDGFDKFCKQHIDVIKVEVNELLKIGFTDAVEIKNKIKKTYKNRYFLLVNNK